MNLPQLKLRDESLNARAGSGICLRRKRRSQAWKEEYNEERPHSSLGYLRHKNSRIELRLRSPTAPYGPRLEDLVEAKVMS